MNSRKWAGASLTSSSGYAFFLFRWRCLLEGGWCSQNRCHVTRNTVPCPTPPVQLHFKAEAQEDPVELYHHLTLYDASGTNNAKRPVWEGFVRL